MDDFKCPLCGSSNYTLFYNKSRNKTHAENFICQTCGFIFILPRMSELHQKVLYTDGGFSQNARSLKTPDDIKYEKDERKARVRFSLLEKETDIIYKPDHRRNFLEVGSGTGSFTRLMQGAGWNAIGLEPDIQYSVASQIRYSIITENLFLEDYKPKMKFDLVASFHFIEHVKDPLFFYN